MSSAAAVRRTICATGHINNVREIVGTAWVQAEAEASRDSKGKGKGKAGSEADADADTDADADADADAEVGASGDEVNVFVWADDELHTPNLGQIFERMRQRPQPAITVGASVVARSVLVWFGLVWFGLIGVG